MWNNYLITSFFIVMLPHAAGFLVKYTLPKRYNLNVDISMSNTDIPTNVLKYDIHPAKIINRLIYDSYQFDCITYL